MGRLSRLAWLLAVLAILCAEAVAQEPLVWELNLERARQTAAQTNRLVLVHFWTPSCVWCKRMDGEVFALPEVARQVQANYVPVKINADQYPDLAKKFGVDGMPTDVILTPQGQVVNVAKGKAEAAQYIARLNQAAANVRQQNAGVLASLPAPANGQSLGLNGPANGSNAAANGMPPEALTPNPIPFNNPPPAGNADIDRAVATLTRNSTVAPATPPNAPSLNVQPNAPPTGEPPANAPQKKAVQLPPGSPPLALEGYCAVSLMEKQQWIPGDVRYGVYHRGQTYLFTGPEEQGRFRADYDRYAPVCSGDDIVLATEEHKTVPGLRAHGVFFADRIFLFANEATLQKFSSNPNYYAGQALGLLRQAVSAGQQPR